MSGKKINYYNVTKDGELIMTGVTNQEAAVISGCDSGQISTYANGKSKGVYHGSDGEYKFEVDKSVFTIPKTIMVKTDKTTITPMTASEIKDWEKYRLIINPEAKKRELSLQKPDSTAM